MDMTRILDALAFSEKLPKAAVRAALASPEETTARTLDITERCIACRDLDDGTVSVTEQNALIILIHIVGELKEPKLFAPLLRLLARDAETLDTLIGDSLTETVPQILVETYDGHADGLYTLMNDARAYEFSRDAAFRAWACLTALGTLPKDAARQYLSDAFHTLEPRETSPIWTSWADAISLLGFDDLVPLVEQAYKDGLVDKQYQTFNDFMHDLRRPADTTRIETLFKSWSLPFFKSTIDELSGWYCFSEAYRKGNRQREIDAARADTVINEFRNVGRNDPCPCGSGKKFKKCCLA